jgi:hypothetical protein
MIKYFLQQRVVEMIMPEDTKIMMQHMGPDECLSSTQKPHYQRAGTMDRLDRFGSTAIPKCVRILRIG